MKYFAGTDDNKICLAMAENVDDIAVLYRIAIINSLYDFKRLVAGGVVWIKDPASE
jgi:hypothetical protein